MGNKVLTHHRYADKKLREVKDWNISEKTKKDIKKFIADYKSGEVTGRIGTNLDATVERVLQYLKPMLEFLEKNKYDTKKFKEALLQDKIKSILKKPYSIRTKKMMFITLCQYLKWKHPEDYVKLSKPLRIRIESKKPEPKYLTIPEIDKLYKNCKNNKERYIIANLFASGTRAEEFLNLRFSDYTLPEKEDNYVRVRVSHEFSKTEGRTISLYYDKSLEATREYLEERKKEGLEPDETVIPDSYGAIKDWLVRFGKRVINKRLHFHLFRSSCATWLSSRLNRNQMCTYFGWKFVSSMPDTYINRNGVEMDDVTEKFERTEIEELRNKLEKSNQKKDLQIEKLRKVVEYDDRVIKENSEIAKLLLKKIQAIQKITIEDAKKNSSAKEMKMIKRDFPELF